MHATIRRYEGVDTTRMSEVVGQVNKTLVPQLRELPGFSGYYLIEAGNGVLSSLDLFETPEQADESTKLVSKWITDENFACSSGLSTELACPYLIRAGTACAT